MVFQSLTGIAGHLAALRQGEIEGYKFRFQSLTGIAGHLAHWDALWAYLKGGSFNPSRASQAI